MKALIAAAVLITGTASVMARGQASQGQASQGQATLGQTAQGQTAPTLKAKTRIVIIDVGVSDAQGRTVPNLKASDFTLKDGGTQQTISHFEEYKALSPGQIAQMPDVPKLEPNVFTNYTPVPEGALNVLLLDTLNTPMDDQAFMRAETLKYLKTQLPGTRMAIFGLNSELKLLQGFTSDPQKLRDVLEGKHVGPGGAPTANPDQSANPQRPQGFFQAIINSMGNDPSSEEVKASLLDFSAVQKAAQDEMRIRVTIDALNNLARYLSSLPGRKNLIWFSGAFAINVLPTHGLLHPFVVGANFEDEFHRTVSMLMRSQVAVYPIDARGLMLAPGTTVQAQGMGMPNGTNSVMKDPQKFFNDTSSEHSTMQDLANDTGGMAAVDDNGLAAAVERAVDAGSNFYSLSYTPSKDGKSGDFHKVQVQLAQAGLKLTYRRGYYADDSDVLVTRKAGGGTKQAPPGTGAAAAGKATYAQMDLSATVMDAAMQFGGPDPTEILFKAAINPATSETEATVARGNVPDPKVLGPFRRYVIYVAALPTDFTVTSVGGGRFRMNVELDTNVYNSNGELLNYATIQFAGEFDEDRYKALMRSGMQFKQEISLPVKGESYLRVGVQDIATSRTGAIEVPGAYLSKLKPLASSSPTAAPPIPPQK